MKIDTSLKKVTVVFENLNEASFSPEDIDGSWVEADSITYNIIGKCVDQKAWIKTMSLLIKNTANKNATSLTGEELDDDLFTYIEAFGWITQVVFDYGDNEVTYFVDSDLTQDVSRKDFGLEVLIQ